MKRISILGCGWLGKPLAVSLLDEGYFVMGSTTRPENLPMLRDLGVNPYLIHLSPSVEAIESDFFQSDVLIISIPPKRKTGNELMFLDQMASLVKMLKNSQTKHVLFISSTSVLMDAGKVVSEVDTDPETVLARVEKMFVNEPAFSCSVLRFGGLVGPGRHPGRFLSGKEIKGANHPVNIIHLRDCIEIIKSIIQKGVWNEVLNACADLHPTKEEFYNFMCSQLKVPPPIFSAGESGFKIVSNEKMKRVLDYTFYYPDPMLMKFDEHTLYNI